MWKFESWLHYRKIFTIFHEKICYGTFLFRYRNDFATKQKNEKCFPQFLHLYLNFCTHVWKNDSHSIYCSEYSKIGRNFVFGRVLVFLVSTQSQVPQIIIAMGRMRYYFKALLIVIRSTIKKFLIVEKNWFQILDYWSYFELIR